MTLLDTLHRWTGGLVGLLLAVFGLSGTLLLHKDAWLRATLPAAVAPAAMDDASLARAIERMAADPALRSIVFANDLGVHTLRLGKGGGYADASGALVARWETPGERVETWLFDLHEHLLMGDTGEVIAGIAALAGFAFVVTGSILWWRTRRTFRLRALPPRLTRPAIVRHHRDLGIVVAPLLLMTFATAAVLALEPVRDALVRPFNSGRPVRDASAPPPIRGGPLAAMPQWSHMLRTARTAYPGAEIRVLVMPAKPGALITLRLRQSAEWLPSGRTTLWFDPATMRLVGQRDALAMPGAVKAFNLAYPLHAAKVGGLAYRLVMTLVGLTLTLLGTLTVFSFWRARRRPRRSGGAVATRPIAAVVRH